MLEVKFIEEKDFDKLNELFNLVFPDTTLDCCRWL